MHSATVHLLGPVDSVCATMCRALTSKVNARHWAAAPPAHEVRPWDVVVVDLTNPLAAIEPRRLQPLVGRATLCLLPGDAPINPHWLDFAFQPGVQVLTASWRDGLLRLIQGPGGDRITELVLDAEPALGHLKPLVEAVCRDPWSIRRPRDLAVRTRKSLAALRRQCADLGFRRIEPIFPGTYLAQTTTWNVQRVKAPEAWPSSTGSGAKLLITDSGIDDGHPDLATAVVQSCESPPTNGIDQFGHGTAVAGIAAAVDNDLQVVGVAPGVALWSSEIGAFAPDPGYAACAVQFGRVNHVDVISMSITVQPSTALTDQINTAYNQDGIVIVVGAGSNGSPVTYPATLASAIAVSATDTNNNFAPFASGPKVELAAPGTTVMDQRGLTSTCLGGTSASTCGFGIVQGTSFSTPHVAAAAAILKAYHPSWTNVNIRNALKNTAVDLGAAGRDNQFGYGLIDIRAALDYVLPPPLSVSISGPTNVRPGATCTWFANPSGGTPPYVQYSWSPPGNNSPEFTYTNSGQPFNISVWVTDADGVSANDGRSVTVSSSAPVCQF